MTFVVLNVVVLTGLILLLEFALRFVVAKTSLSNWHKQLCFVSMSGMLLTPIGLPIGIGLAILAPNFMLLPFLAMPGALGQIAELYSMTSAVVVPSFFLTLAASWWLGSKKFPL